MSGSNVYDNVVVRNQTISNMLYVPSVYTPAVIYVCASGACKAVFSM